MGDAFDRFTVGINAEFQLDHGCNEHEHGRYDISGNIRDAGPLAVENYPVLIGMISFGTNCSSDAFLGGRGARLACSQKHDEKPFGDIGGPDDLSGRARHRTGRWPLCKLSLEAVVRQSEKQPRAVLLGRRWAGCRRSGLGCQGRSLPCSPGWPVDHRPG